MTEGLFAPTCAQNCSHAHHEEEEDVDEKEEEPVEEVEEEAEQEIAESDVEMDEEDVVVPDNAPPQQVRGHGLPNTKGVGSRVQNELKPETKETRLYCYYHAHLCIKVCSLFQSLPPSVLCSSQSVSTSTVLHDVCYNHVAPRSTDLHPPRLTRVTLCAAPDGRLWQRGVRGGQRRCSGR